MFAQMISDLKNGSLPDTTLLRKRFDAALVKKIGVIRTPYPFWPTDTKINPSAKHLLWAAVLLDDQENFRMVEAIISSELEEKQKAKGQTYSNHDLASKTAQLLHTYIHDLIELAPTEIFREELKNKTTKIVT